MKQMSPDIEANCSCLMWM